MSHEIVRSLKIDEERKTITVVSADSSVRPLHFRDLPYYSQCADFSERLKALFEDIMGGEIQLYKSTGKIRIITDQCIKYWKTIVGDVWSYDWKYRANFKQKVYDALYEHIFIMWYLRMKCDYFGAQAALYSIKAEMDSYKAAYLQKLKDEGKVMVKCTSISDIYNGYVVCITDPNNETILAPKINYDSKGLLDNSKGYAVFLGKDSEYVFNFLRFDGLFHGKCTKLEIIDRLVTHYGEDNRERVTNAYIERFQLFENVVQTKLDHIKMNKLPYVDFPIKDPRKSA